MESAQPTPLVIITENGKHIDASKLTVMALELDQARAAAAFPPTAAPEYAIQATCYSVRHDCQG